MLSRGSRAANRFPQLLCAMQPRINQNVESFGGRRAGLASSSAQARGGDTVAMAIDAPQPETPKPSNVVRAFAQLRRQNQHFQAFDLLHATHKQLQQLAGDPGAIFLRACGTNLSNWPVSPKCVRQTRSPDAGESQSCGSNTLVEQACYRPEHAPCNLGALGDCEKWAESLG